MRFDPKEFWSDLSTIQKAAIIFLGLAAIWMLAAFCLSSVRAEYELYCETPALSSSGLIQSALIGLGEATRKGICD